MKEGQDKIYYLNIHSTESKDIEDNIFLEGYKKY